MPALPRHTTTTTDSPWDASEQVKKIKTPLTHKVADAEWAWQDPEKDSTTKSAYKFPHHEVDADGVPGAASTASCTTSIGILNGGMGGADIPAADRHAVWEHLQKHLQDAGVTPPKLDKVSKPPANAKARRADLAGPEVRTVTARGVQVVEQRDAAGATSGYHLSGFASVTDSGYEMSDWAGPYTEVVRSGAFTKTLNENADVRLLVNHDGVPLARTKSGTLTLREVMPGEGPVTGLWCEADLDPTSPAVQEIRSAMSRGDLDEMSFMFMVTRQQWSPDFEQRDILEVRLFDVSVVTFPANPGAVASMRSAVARQLRWAVGSARVQAARAELRSGKTLSAATMEVLEQVLDLVAAADRAVDEAQPLLADLMGVDNPDDPGEAPDPDVDPDDDDGSSTPDDDGVGERTMPLSLFEARIRVVDSV